MSFNLSNKELQKNIIILETEVKHLSNDLRLTSEEYETSRKNYFEIYTKLAHANDLLQDEITEKKLAREALAVRLRYEEGLANFSRALIVNSKNPIKSALQHLIAASQAKRVYLYKNVKNSANVLCMKLIYEIADEHMEQESNQISNKLIPWKQGFNKWRLNLAKRLPVIGNVEDFQGTSKDFFIKQHIHSVLILPIFVNNKWYGYIGFDEAEYNRVWLQDDIKILQTAGEILGVYIERKIAEKKLRLAKRAAEEANKLKSQFVFNISHEMRTPLNGIIGFSESILNSENIDDIQKYSKTVLQQSELLLLLISDLLDHAKIEAGKMIIEKQPFDLLQLLERLHSTLGVLCKTKDLHFDIHIGDGVLRNLEGDSLRLLQILMNFGSNAVKFTDKGSVLVKVSVVEKKQDQIVLLFSVIDSGIGIPKDKQSVIFNSFTQADGSITRKYGGTGLGTTIARQLVELMYGEFGLESEPGEGSHFWFKVPLGITDSNVVVASDFSSNVSEFREFKNRTGLILVAEDYAPNRQLVLSHLENAGYTVEFSENGRDAVKLCNKNKYDLVLMDVQMPVMDGYQATRAIRNSSVYCKDIPILAITAHADSTSRESCLRAGMNDVIVKPIRRDSFLTVIDRWMSGKVNEHIPVPAMSEMVASKMLNFPPMDYEKAIFEFGGNKTVLDTVLTQFLQNLDEQMAIFKDAFACNDCEKVRTEAHRVRGGAANLTAMQLAASAEKMERMASSKNMENGQELLLLFEKDYNKLKDFVNNRVQGNNILAGKEK